MAQELVLALLEFNDTFVLETDASNYGIGVVLMQKKRPIPRYSKALCPYNQGLSVYEKELHAITSVVAKWRHYLEDKPFIIKTDHFNLKYLLQ